MPAFLAALVIYIFVFLLWFVVAQSGWDVAVSVPLIVGQQLKLTL